MVTYVQLTATAFSVSNVGADIYRYILLKQTGRSAVVGTAGQIKINAPVKKIML
jgi:hypothetical protein